MTKEQEIAALRTFADSLPADSYIGPWLRSIVPSVAQDLRCDKYPEGYSVQTYAAQVVALRIAESRKVLDELRDQKEKAERDLETVSKYKQEATKELMKALHAIENN